MSAGPSLLELLPHANATLNAANVALLVLGRMAIRRGERDLHRRHMLSAAGVGLVFIVSYAGTTFLRGHGRFPGDDWVRSLFLAILGTHTVLAVIVVPLVARTLFLARRERFAEHRRIAPTAYWIWLYVASTGVIIYVFNNWVRPAA